MAISSRQKAGAHRPLLALPLVDWLHVHCSPSKDHATSSSSHIPRKIFGLGSMLHEWTLPGVARVLTMYFREGGAVHPWKPLLYYSRIYASRRHLQLVPAICLPQAFMSASAIYSLNAS
jgi:hypothetical protein